MGADFDGSAVRPGLEPVGVDVGISMKAGDRTRHIAGGESVENDLWSPFVRKIGGLVNVGGKVGNCRQGPEVGFQVVAAERAETR